MSHENIDDSADIEAVGADDDEPPQRGLPLQPDIGLGVEINDNRRNQESSGGTVSFSHFLNRGPGGSSSGLPDFVQDHLPADMIAFDLRQQSRSSCDNSNQTLPDFLSDTQRNVNADPQPSGSNSLGSLQGENNNLRRELQCLRRQITQQRVVISGLEQQIQEQRNNRNENFSPNVPSSSDSQQISSLQQEVESLRRENRSLKRNVSSMSSAAGESTSRSSRLSQQLRSNAQHSENLLRELMNNVSRLQQLAAHVDDVEQQPQDYTNRNSDSEDD